MIGQRIRVRNNDCSMGWWGDKNWQGEGQGNAKVSVSIRGAQIFTNASFGTCRPIPPP